MPLPVRVVLVHGSQLSGAQWTRYGALLGPDVEVVVPDLPAHGSRRGGAFTWEGALEVIGDAVAGDDPSVPVVLAGHSLGGYLAMAWASEHPTELAGLALLGATAVPRARARRSTGGSRASSTGSASTGCRAPSTGSSTPSCRRTWQP